MMLNTVKDDKKRIAARPSASCAKNGGPARTRSSDVKGRVLVMDDDPIIRDVASLMLKSLGYAVYAAEGGEETVECYRRAQVCGFPFRAVILGTNISFGTEGKETVGRLSSIDPQVRAIAMSGNLSDPGNADFAACGFCGALMKPFTLDELQRALNTL